MYQNYNKQGNTDLAEVRLSIFSFSNHILSKSCRAVFIHQHQWQRCLYGSSGWRDEACQFREKPPRTVGQIAQAVLQFKACPAYSSLISLSCSAFSDQESNASGPLGMPFRGSTAQRMHPSLATAYRHHKQPDGAFVQDEGS